MNSKYNGSMGYQRLIKQIKRDTGGGGGGPPGPDSVGTSQLINGTITTADIALGTIDISNLSASCIASLSGGGGGLTANSVDSSHIINGSILTADICDNAITNAKIAHNAVGNTNVIDGAITHVKLSSNCIESHNIKDGAILAIDICDNTITGSKIAVGTITSSNILDRTILGIDISLGQIGEAHFDASFTEQLTNFAVALEEDGDAIKELQKAQGVISIRNSNIYDQDFTYTLSYKHPSTGVLTEFASYSKLSYKLTATHFFKMPSLTHYILIAVSNAGGVGVEGADMIYGATIEETDGNNILLSGTYDNNIMVEINVAI
jgi:hypothetical protein